ncbi:HAMP domain-containing sensor histidine kinase [Piscinibacter gummiphilus]|uniref:Signal transduction histidine-protein kinase/phosphatase MprB n=1 Tax=Piscinibacter gummiphilus TaxID=946333 RepID=A0ABZ0CVP5_9BURK|nr:HAMP domain-containing sensor histidine kinase [Piscinibacter gummiphilus]WOB09052.1 HAMP domain-containing sensor histidine kinase [Piscinibacter gummiphilus]
MHRYSFRQLLLVAFLLIAALLSAASLRGLFTLEKLLRQSSDGARRAVAHTADAQLLAERTVAMERSARQYLVLEDPVLRQRFEEAGRDARDALKRLADNLVSANLAAEWQAHESGIEDQLKGTPADLREREASITNAFRELEGINDTIANQVRVTTEQRNQVLMSELEAGRAELGRQMLIAIVVAVLLAFVFGLWLARPLKRLEQAVIGLGENRLDQPIEIRGPSDVRLLGRRLEWLRLRLAELDSDKSRFLRHVSHELKTPLAALREGVSLLEEGVTGTLSDDQKEVARILRQNTALLQSQIEDLLRFNAAAFEARKLVRQRVELTGLLKGLVARQRLQWQARQLAVKVEGDALWAEVDPDKLGTALGNLLSNAIRFSPPGATIRLCVTRVPGRACIDIVDQGPGVAAVDRARVFEPFYRGERQPSDAVRGTGIGLSIVHEYITAHGGVVELQDDGPGAHFHIELPHAR